MKKNFKLYKTIAYMYYAIALKKYKLAHTAPTYDKARCMYWRGQLAGLSHIVKRDHIKDMERILASNLFVK